MKFRQQLTSWMLVLLFCCSLIHGQQSSSVASTAVPRLVNFSGRVTDAQDKAISGVAGATFAIYKDQYEGLPLWLETQNIQADTKGNYVVQLGATKPEGLPLDLFTSGEARWLGVSINGGQEEPRVLLLSVPYALKAADAETIRGLPPSAFVLAVPSVGSSAESSASSAPASPSTTPPPASTVTTSGGTVNALPLWTTGTNIQSSAVKQTGSGTSAKIGVNTATPATTLDVNGAETVRGNLSLPATGTATSTGGKNSQPATLTSSVFNSTTGTAVAENFRWQAEPVGNNTSAATGSLNLLYGAGSNAVAETGLKIGHNGQITFASGQTFPGTGPGTVTSVGLSAPSSDFTVSGSPVTGSGTLALNWAVSPTNLATPNSIVKRDSSGSFFAATISTSGFIVGQGVTGDVSQQRFGVVGSAERSKNGVGVLGSDNHGFFGSVASSIIGTAPIGMIGDGDGYGVAATSDTSNALIVANGTGTTNDAAVIIANGGGAPIFADGTGGSLFLDGNGNLSVSGAISAGTKDFKIDHPLDPANKYLYHASVESSEMKNIYDGVASLDGSGTAIVKLPEWFSAVNSDFRYQLTAIGAPAPNLYIATKINNNQFTIAGGQPGMGVSWQVTGVRHDAFAKAHPLQVSVDKTPDERGYYIHPELYGASREKSLASAHRAEQLRQIREKSTHAKAVRP